MSDWALKARVAIRILTGRGARHDCAGAARGKRPSLRLAGTAALRHPRGSTSLWKWNHDRLRGSSATRSSSKATKPSWFSRACGPWARSC